MVNMRGGPIPIVIKPPVPVIPTPVKPRTGLGVNLSFPNYYSGVTGFVNLAAGDNWRILKDNKWSGIPDDRWNEDRTSFALQSGESAGRNLNKPNAALAGQDTDCVVTWEGSAKVTLLSAANAKIGKNSATYTQLAKGSVASIRFTAQTAPIRNLVVKPVGAPDQLFDPAYIEHCRQYARLRFVKWMPAVEANATVRWATRCKPGQAGFYGDTVPVEYMVALANLVGRDPWFNMPWNADEEYIRKFAEYVRDNLDPRLVAYVETSNEYWNSVYKVYKQSLEEGKLLANNPGGATSRRYGQRLAEMMKIWTEVFRGQTSRIVRVAAFQNGSTWSLDEAMKMPGARDYTDVVASAPYFAASYAAGYVATVGLDAIFVDLKAKADEALRKAQLLKDAAAGYGKGYVTYEAGQHVVSAKDVPQLELIERDPRMGQLYAYYLPKLMAITDRPTLFADFGRIDQYGAWGMQEWIGQKDAPKANAVQAFMAKAARA